MDLEKGPFLEIRDKKKSGQMDSVQNTYACNHIVSFKEKKPFLSQMPECD
jgi:hypothetical protein